jgi:hypothetical protein
LREEVRAGKFVGTCENTRVHPRYLSTSPRKYRARVSSFVARISARSASSGAFTHKAPPSPR